MARKPTHEELEQTVKELEKGRPLLKFLCFSAAILSISYD